MKGRSLYVHFSGRGAQRRAILDVYEFETGRYLHSIALPRKVHRVFVGGSILYGEYETPYPVIEGWALRATEDDTDPGGP